MAFSVRYVWAFTSEQLAVHVHELLVPQRVAKSYLCSTHSMSSASAFAGNWASLPTSLTPWMYVLVPSIPFTLTATTQSRRR